MAGDTRARMIDATVEAMRHRGVKGMSFTEVLQESGAARGAIYHHFPGGKAQLVDEAAAHNGRDVRANLAALPAESPAGVIEAFLAAVRPVVEAAAGGSGCAVAAAAVGSEPDDPLRQTAATAFTSWIDQLAERFMSAGLPEPESTDLAAALITLLEGAQILCRALGTLEPYEQAARAARALA